MDPEEAVEETSPTLQPQEHTNRKIEVTIETKEVIKSSSEWRKKEEDTMIPEEERNRKPADIHQMEDIGLDLHPQLVIHHHHRHLQVTNQPRIMDREVTR